LIQFGPLQIELNRVHLWLSESNSSLIESSESHIEPSWVRLTSDRVKLDPCQVDVGLSLDHIMLIQAKTMLTKFEPILENVISIQIQVKLNW